MEKELNIAAILKEKPVNTRLHDISRNVTLLFKEIDGYENIECSLIDGLILKYTNEGRMYQYPTGMEVLKPSAEMRDWSKFAWKRGDVLVNGNGMVVMFDGWANDEYTEFNTIYNYYNDNTIGEEEVCDTSCFSKVTKDIRKKFLDVIEEHYNGKLNLETLEIEQPKPEFKDGDIVFIKGAEGYKDYIDIFSHFDDGEICDHAVYDIKKRILDCSGKYPIGEYEYQDIRLATDSEKQQLFDALAKENKAWNEDKKMLVDLPKKYVFKALDLCLMRDIGERWKLCQFGFFDKKNDFDRSPYNAVGGNWYNECIPYNDQTAHLLGTTDEWKGGEE